MAATVKCISCSYLTSTCKSCTSVVLLRVGMFVAFQLFPNPVVEPVLGGCCWSAAFSRDCDVCPTLSLVLSSSNSGVDSVQFCFPLAQSFVLNWGKKFPSCKKGPVSFCFPQTQCRTSWVLEQGTVGYRGSSTAAVEPQTPLCPC